MATNDIKQFGNAARGARDEGEEDLELEVMILDRKIHLNSPGSGQLSYLAMTIASNNRDLLTVGRLINFIVNLMDDDDQGYVSALLLDRDSGFDGEDIVDVAEYVVEEWSSRPTQTSTGSSKSPQATGRRSTGATRKAGSTPSRSRSTAS